jgi:iron complex outermembrane receptor protein
LISSSVRQRLLATSSLKTAMALAAPMAISLGMFAAPAQALAQDTTTTAPTQEVVVTGSIIRHKNAESISPLTVVTAADLEQRGITTITDAVQNLSGNNSGALPNSFTANGAFAAGASAVSLRGLLSQSTLVLIDGMRAAYYPLADDGSRNFVDLNTIPDVIVDRVEVLQDGASSTYGADAIAGVVNVITKKSYQGLTVKAEGGWTEHGGAGEKNLQLLAGRGDLGVDGYNAYIGLEYEKDEALYNRQRGFPFNTSDLSSICISTGCLYGGNPNLGVGVQNAIVNGSFNGLYGNQVAVTRPYNAAGTAAIAGSHYNLANPALGCGALTPTVVNATTAPTASSAYQGGTFCQNNPAALYGIIEPGDERFSISGHFVKNLAGGAQMYAEVNYYQNTVEYQHAPAGVTGTTPPLGSLPRFANSPLILPLYVCPGGSATHVCTAADPGATLNPTDPYASLGQSARLLYSLGDVNRTNTYFSQAYRFATGVKGDAFGWNYNVDLTGMQSDLQVTQRGYVYLTNFLTAVNQGTYNFLDPSKNSAAIRSFVSPDNVTHDNSKLLQLQGSVNRTLFQLPGGPVQLGLGASVRYESLYDPSANPQPGSASDRYLSINPFYSIGERSVYSGYGELDLPVLKNLDANLSGRYDKYSSGQDHFSPKFGVKYTPFPMLTLRGTYSEGFAIPSFAQTSGSVTGYVTEFASSQPACVAAHPLPAGNAYCTYSIGLTNNGNPNLQPQTSTNLTYGFVLQPLHGVIFTADYYRIEEKHIIASGNYQPALAAYYAGGNPNALPGGFTVVPDVADINNPGAIPRAAFVVAPNQNQNSFTTDGFDFSLSYRTVLPWWSTKFTSSLQGSYVKSFTEKLADGEVYSFAGTEGPTNPTAGSGTPRTRFNWQNSLDFGKFTVAATVYYTSGYKTTGEDATGPGTRGDCVDDSIAAFYSDGTPYQCKIASFTTVTLNATYQVTKHIQLYVNVDDLFDKAPPIDTGTYGANNYNPVFGNAGIIGRSFKVGAKAVF